MGSRDGGAKRESGDLKDEDFVLSDLVGVVVIVADGHFVAGLVLGSADEVVLWVVDAALC